MTDVAPAKGSGRVQASNGGCWEVRRDGVSFRVSCECS